MSLSISDFQKIANGYHNAGDITLTGSGKLDKVNNHVGMLKGWNTKTDYELKPTVNLRTGAMMADGKIGVVASSYEIQITGLGSGNPQIASVGFRQEVEALDMK